MSYAVNQLKPNLYHIADPVGGEGRHPVIADVLLEHLGQRD